MIKKVSWVILILIIIILMFYWEMAVYGIRQAKGQLAITFNTQPIEEVLADSSVVDSLKQKLKIIEEAREFSFDHLGLNPSNNYTSYYDQKGEVALWNLSASEPYLLEPKVWKFPFLGSFPYKGFFELERAQIEGDELKNQGFDIRIRPVSGWSTLGWTNDPVLSNMLSREEGSLVELIIHELTHSTVFIKDDIEFNENLASFVGEKGALLFLNRKYGKNSEPYFDYIFSEEDSKTFRQQMLLGTSILDSLYHSFQDKSDSIKALQKEIVINKIISSIDTLHFHDHRYYQVFDDSRPNNAYFMSFLRYYSSKDSLETLLFNAYNNDLKEFVKGMKKYHK